MEQIRGGNEAAFEVVFERHSRGILSFCRHMLGSTEEAEDAVQHTFASAYRTLLQDEREIKLKAWLYTIARNRCLSMLRARREEPGELPDLPTAGLQEEVQRRADLQDLLRDLRELPDEQRAALLLAEVSDLPHAEIADILEVEVPKVKALVFRARSGLMDRKEGREMPCQEVREQLSTLRGGSLRRTELRHHLRSCEGCRAFREEVRRQRSMLAVALPVIPSAGLKASVLGAIGIGGGSAGGGAAAGGLAAVGGLSSATAAKVAAVAVLAGGGIVAGDALLDDPAGILPGSESTPAEEAGRGSANGIGNRESRAGGDGAGESRGSPSRGKAERGGRGERRGKSRRRRRRGAGTPAGLAPGAGVPQGKALGHVKQQQPKTNGQRRAYGAPSPPPVRRRGGGARPHPNPDGGPRPHAGPKKETPAVVPPTPPGREKTK